MNMTIGALVLMAGAVAVQAAKPPMSPLARQYKTLESLQPFAIVQQYDFGIDRDVADGTIVPYVKCPVKPLVDVPLRDASICRGPDGTYYLTGTSGPDFQNNKGIRLWKSKDGVQWEDLGLVWDITDAKNFPAQSRWMQFYRLNPECPERGPVRGVTSPEIHYLKDTFYIPFAMNEQGCALLKSVSGKAEGPYVNIAMGAKSVESGAKICTRGGTPSLFLDDDGTVYFVWGEGWIAKMNDELTGLAEKPRLLTVTPDSAIGDYPSNCGRRGAFLFKAQGKYHLVAEDINARLGHSPCRDTFVAVADSIFGPYSTRKLLLPHGGQICVFKDGKGRFNASFSGHAGDPYALCQDRPAIFPLVQDGFLKRVARRQWVVSEAGLVARIKPCWDKTANEPLNMSHPLVTLEDDGYYYVTGSNEKDKAGVPGIRVWRSRNLQQWERIQRADAKDGFIWSCAQGDWTAKPSASRAVPYPHHDLWGAQLFRHAGRYWIPFYMFNKNQTGLVQSAGADVAGPYALTGFTWQDGSPHLFRDDDGSSYMLFCFGPPRIGKLKLDLSGFEIPPRDVTYANACRQGDESAWLIKVAGKYVLFHSDHTGPDKLQNQGKPIYEKYDTWDFCYSVADSIMGPYSAPRFCVPHGGTGSVFQDKAGHWWAALFGEDSTAPFNSRLGFVPLVVTNDAGNIIIRVADQFPAGMDMAQNMFPENTNE